MDSCEYFNINKETIKANGMLNSIIDTINPIQKEIPDSKKLIRLIGLIFSGMFIYLFVKRYHFIKYMITDFQEVLDFSLVFFLFPLIIILIGTIFFWKQKKTGWILLLIFMTYSATDAIIALSFVLRNPFEPSVLDSLFPSVPPIAYFGKIFFYIGCIWTMSRSDIREIYKVAKIGILNSVLFGISIAYIFFKVF